MEEKEEQKISKYNSGVAIQIRIDSLWKDANNHSRAGLFYKWNLDLDAIWRELARDIKEKDYQGKKEKYDEFDTKLVETGKFKDYGGEGFKKEENDDLQKRGKQYKILMEKELFLKRLENELGKGTAYDEGDDYDFD